jgi:hypothetical protein
MATRDWTNPHDYRFADVLNGAQWGWEFLRRNPAYQHEWRRFDEVWQALEAAYGRPPQRDFCAWKNDPRAWVHAAECPEGDCRVDQDKVLIECAFGARWGFYKFPPDPADDDPVGDGRLVWRELEESIPLLMQGDAEWLGEDPARVALGFDLGLPLRHQLERAKRTLQVLQRQRQRSGEVQALSLRTQRAALTTMLRLLDGEAAGAGEEDMQAFCSDWRDLLAQAHRLRDDGYRRLAGLRA